MLPHNNEVTLSYCNPKRFCGFLVVDGKFVAVKGYDRKIPFIYGIDYLTHDIPICLLAPSENYSALLQYFTKLKNTGYDLQALICDDNESIRMAAKQIYPGVIVQLCHVHYLENVRRNLNIHLIKPHETGSQARKESVRGGDCSAAQHHDGSRGCDGQGTGGS